MRQSRAGMAAIVLGNCSCFAVLCVWLSFSGPPHSLRWLLGSSHYIHITSSRVEEGERKYSPLPYKIS